MIMMVDKSETKSIAAEIGSRSQYYREITPSSFWGGVRPGYIEAIVITTRTNALESMLNNKIVIEHTEEICLKLTPPEAKALVVWLLNKLREYESIHGHIKSAEELGKPTVAPEIIVQSEVDDLIAGK